MMATRRPARSVRRTTVRAAAAAAAVLALLAACSSGTSDDSGSGGDSGGSSSLAGPAEAAPEAARGDVAADVSASQVTDEQEGATEVQQQQLISTGTVQLHSGDVGDAIFDVRKVVDAHGGTVAQDATETDDDGDPLRSRMVLRIPTTDFDAAMDELEEVATLDVSDRTTEDVTTQVVDTAVRVDAQRRSIERIQVLFAEATSIKDIVSIEHELSRRQADLASLEQQQRYLSDQTDQSTISVTVERTSATKPAEDDDTGFLAGLGAGWSGLETFAVGLATVAGALLPWLVVLLVLAVPGWPLYRRLRRRGTSLA